MTGIILHLSAGAGPPECDWVVAKLVTTLCAEAVASGLACEAIEPVSGPVPSALLRVEGEAAPGFADACCGTIRWIGTSPFRAHHKRKNWFVGIARAPGTADVPELREEDIAYQTLRASGPGGQHVNTTDSAVRATHKPTGLATVSQDQRSQFANKKIARLKLSLLFEQQRMTAAAGGKRALWDQAQALERGNAVRTYQGQRFLRKSG
jgi:peptide chain release factor